MNRILNDRKACLNLVCFFDDVIANEHEKKEFKTIEEVYNFIEEITELLNNSGEDFIRDNEIEE